MKINKWILIILLALSLTEVIGLGLALWDNQVAWRLHGWRPWSGKWPKFNDNYEVVP